MIINIRGTSGSGKSTLAREIMDCYETPKPRFMLGRKRPLCYVLNRKRESLVTTPLVVIGSYENVCGGADTVPNRDQLFRLVRFWDDQKHDVLFEGVVYSDEVVRTVALHTEGRKLMVVGLETTIEICLTRINRRRRKKNPQAKDVDPTNTTNRVRIINRALERLRLAEVPTVTGDGRKALRLIQRALGLALPE